WQYTAAETGTMALEARVDPENAVGECVESNNVLTAEMTVLPKPPANLALNKTVTVSSVEASGLEGWKAVDGSLGTRWSSAFSDPQSIMIDLGASTYLTDMLIVWEAAYAKEYQVQLSTNSLVWQTVKTETNGTGGSVKIALGQTARYVRITGTKRATVYGYSIYEIEVHGESNTTPVKSEAETGAVREFRLEQNHPNPFNPSTHIRYALEERSRVKLEVMDVLGRRVAELVDADLASGAYEAVWHAEGLASGVYFCRIEAASREHPGTMFVTTRRMLLMR
ncbi:MAG: discoidin domain-containing protein, partial [Acidobacteriota bacterium]